MQTNVGVDALRFFQRRVTVRLDRAAAVHAYTLRFGLTGELWVNPLPEKLFIKTELDLESSQCSIKEAGNG